MPSRIFPLPPRLDLYPISVGISNRNVDWLFVIGRRQGSIPISSGIRRDDFQVDTVIELSYDLLLVGYAINNDLAKQERLAAIGQI